MLAAAEMARPANAITSNVNPPLITKTGDHYVYESSYQNPGFYAQGRYWVFYENYSMCEGHQGCLVYASSLDGKAFGGFHYAGVTPIHVTDSDWSVVTDPTGTYAYYARYNETSFQTTPGQALLFGMGLLNGGGTISWNPEQIVRSPNPSLEFPNEAIGVDSNGQVWIGYQQDNVTTGGIETPHIIHSNSTLPLSQPLSTSFTLSPTKVNATTNVTFTASPLGGVSPYAYAWTFGDGQSATTQIAAHQYVLPGNYTVTQTTTDNQQQTAVATERILVGPTLLPTNQTNRLTLQVPSSQNVKVGSVLNFRVNASDPDNGEIVNNSTSMLPLGASFNTVTGVFRWTPTASQGDQRFTINFTATDTGNPTLFLMNQVIFYVSPLWSGDTLLSTSGSSGNWHVDIASIGNGDQIYATYWVEGNPLFGKLFNGLAWGGEEQVSSSTTATDVNSFVFSPGANVTAIYYDTNSKRLFFSSRGSGGGWGPDVIDFVGAGPASSFPGSNPDGTLNGKGRYSLPFTAAFDQADSRFYVFWYNETSHSIDEWSGAYTSWLKTPGAFSTGSAVPESTIGSFHYAASVSGKNAFGLMWIDGTSQPFNLNFGLETVAPVSGFTTDTSWNPKVACTPWVVSIEQILGSQTNSSGGATESGSVFSPGILANGIPNGEAKRWLTPGPSTPPTWVPPGPSCMITNADGQLVSAFVEVRGVQRGFLLNEDYSPTFDAVNGGGLHPGGMNLSDTTFNIFTPGFDVCTAANTTGCMHTIHMEFDHDWKAAGYCGPNTTCDSHVLATETGADKTLIDFQGFIFWDSDHVNDASHSFSGWELHPITAWRISNTPADFSLSANPNPVTIRPGTSQTSNITIHSFNIFSGPLPLSATISPSGPTITIPSTVNVKPCNDCGITFATLNITTSLSDFGNYTIVVTGGVGVSARHVSVIARVLGFTVKATPQTLTIQAGSSANSTITVTSAGGFTGTVNLATSTGAGSCTCITAHLSSSSVFLSAGGNQNVTLIVSAGSQTGNATMTVSGTSTTSSASTIVTVTGVDFSVTSAKTVLTLNSGSTNSTSINLASSNGFSGTVTLTAVSNSTALTVALGTPSVTLVADGTGSDLLSVNGTRAGNYLVTITASSGSLSHQIFLLVKIQDFSITSITSIQVNVGATGTATINLASLNGFTGPVILTNSTLPSGLTVTVSPTTVTLSSGGTGSSLLSFSDSATGNFTITLTGTNGALKHTIVISVRVVDFSIVAGPVFPTNINVGSQGNSTITLQAKNGFTGGIGLAVSASSPSGLTCSLLPSVILPPSPATPILSCRASIPGNYTVAVTGTNGGLTHTTGPLMFHIVDFSIRSFTTTLTIPAGSSSTGNTIQLTSLNGFSGTVSLTTFASGAGPSASLAQTSRLLKPGDQNVTLLTIFAGPIAGSFNITVTGANGVLSHSAIITLIVTPASPSIATSLSFLSITAGGSVSDSAILSGVTTTAVGSVTYSLFSNGVCAAPGATISTVAVFNGVVPNSRSVVFNATGSYSFNATYSGDSSNNRATSSCEPLTVTRTFPTLATSLSAGTVVVGTGVTDSATLTNIFRANGTLTYTFFTNGICTSPGTTASIVIVTNSLVPNSRAVTFNATGSYSFQAAYSGDADNNLATSPCEPLNIQKASPNISTALSSPSIVVGTNANDTATLTGAFTPGGTVSYELFTNGVCTSSNTIVSVVTVSAGLVPGSRFVSFNATGAYSFQAIYSGDLNNNAASSSCEPLTVNKISPTITTSLSSTTPAVGTTVTDSATMTTDFRATGTVTYSVFANGGCTGSGTPASTVTVSNGSVPNSRPILLNSTGSFSLNTVYSGDSNNSGAISTCEPLTVIKTSPAISTTLSSVSIIVGGVATDSASLSNSFSAGGTVTYTDFTNGVCTAPGTIVSIVAVTGSSVPNSRSVIFNSTGNYAFQASYSGDANNNPALSPCEPLGVGTVAVTITTNLSTTSIIVGQSVTDSATLHGATSNAGGTVAYQLFAGGTCSGTGSTVSLVAVTNANVPSSRSVTFNSTGPFAFQAAYSGDTNNAPANSSCEPLTVVKSSPTITTALSATTIMVGGSVSDSATLTGGYQAGGTATYEYFTGSTCTGAGTNAGTPVTVTGGVIPASISQPFNVAGPYSWNATYSGDANNNGASSPCEPMTVSKANPTITTSLSATTITVGSSATDSATLTGGFQAGGSATYEYFSGSACTGTATIVGTPVTVANGGVPASAAQAFNSAGPVSWNAAYSGDANNNGATSTCEPLTVSKTNPTIATTLSATTIIVGGSVTDSSALTGSFQAGGTVTYEFFTGSTCTGTATTVGTVVTVAGGAVPNSAAQAFNSAGSFSWNAVYSGDANNNGATSACETLTVSKANPTIATTLSATTITVGGFVSDSSALTSAFSASGTVTYEFFSGSTCTGTATTAGSPVTVTGSVVPNSATQAFNSAGAFSWNAVYSGDANNNGATSPCEPLTVNKTNPTIASTLSATTITVGGSVSDSSVLTGSFSTGGTVTYNFFTGGTCTGTPIVVSTVTVTGGVVPNSAARTFATAGAFSWNAVYSGDPNNNGATSPCEPLTVNKTSPTIATTLSSVSITVGTSVTDSSTLSGSFSAGGTATYEFFTGSTCTGTSTTVGTPVTITGGVVPNSASQAFNSAGAFSWNAVYSGDSNNNGATSPCEPLTVNKTNPTIATTLSATTITVGGSVSDSSTLTGSFQAGGTVTYEFFTGTTCTGSATTVGTPVTVTGGVVPNSASQVFNSAGAFSWNAVYSGDVNNNAVTSLCESLTVSRASPAITTQLSATNITVGTSVTDSSTISSFFQAGGTVTYNEFAGSTCAGTATVVSTPTVTNGVAPNSAPVEATPAGSFSFDAVYSGDANNNGATSVCEPLTVNKASPTITTTLSATTITVGTSVTDTSTMASFFQASGTLSYSEFSGGVCAGTATLVSTVTVTIGVVPNSASATPTPAGSFSFEASYSGDANNNVATSTCEPLTVTKATPTIATALSATTITVGTAVTDSASLASFFQAGGTVTYNEFSGATCAATATILSTVTVTNGIVPNSASVAPTPAGSYSFNAAYSGDANNNVAASACEPLTVNKASPTIATSLSATTIIVGTSVTDSSAMSGSFQAGGIVTYSEFNGAVCAGTATIVSTLTVTNGIVPNSASITPNPAGSFSFNVIYSGDANNIGAASVCEPLTVNKASPTITTSTGATITVGSSVTDSATLASSFQAGGTVTYNEFIGATCTGTPSVVSTASVNNGIVPNSATVTPAPAGSYSFDAAYSGDANNNAATSVCEPLTVSKTSPTITTTLLANPIQVGQAVTDSASLSNSFQAGGTLTYSVFTNSVCTSPGVVVSTVTVTNSVVPNSRAVTFNVTGSYSFQATYSGDSNNNGFTSTCEPLTVNSATGVSLSTTLSSSAPFVGTSVTDTATLSGAVSASGTVTYLDFANAGCSSTGTVVSVVTVTNGAVPTSRVVTFNATGSYSFQAAYSGDTNNNPATSLCEALTVQKDNPIITTTLASSTITVGNSVTDASSLIGAYNAGGITIYEFFSSNTCSGTSTTVGSPVTVTNGVIPNSASQAFNVANAYSWNAIYLGDSNNNGATSQCEPLTVSKASPSISTALSSTAPVVGTSITDSAILTNGFAASGTATYSLFSNSACSVPGTVASTVSVTGGSVPDSRAVLFNSTGSFSFQISYSGDSNNNPTTSSCELFIVQKASPTIITTLSSSTPIVGTTVTDTTTLTGGFQATGAVTYATFNNGACTGSGKAASIATLVSGLVPDSRPVLFNATGAYSFKASYSGDPNNNPVSNDCEPLTIQKATPAISTSLTSTTPLVGTTVTDSATLSGGDTPSGTVTYTLFTNSFCAASGGSVSVVAIAGGVVPNSRAVLFNSTGSFAFQATYNGDANNNPAVATCEPLSVQLATPTIATALSSTAVSVGSLVSDSATISSSYKAGGTVTYNVFSSPSCSGAANAVGTPVTVTNGVVPSSASEAFNAAGSFSWNAVYSGDPNNNVVASACEPLTVNQANPTLTTTLSTNTPMVGTTVTDSAVLTNSFNAGGTTTYTLYANSVCSGTGTLVSLVTVVGGTVSNSRAVLFNSTGTFSFQAAYGGDSNNAPSTSLCEGLAVQKVSPSIATTLSSTSIIVGSTVTDSATLTNGFDVGGTVAYTVFSNAGCTALGVTASIVTVTSNIAPNSRSVTFNATGSYSFQATYSGDADNRPASSPCEPLTVQKATPTIGTTLPSTSITVGTTVTDSSSITSAYKASGTVTYNLFTTGTCTGSASIISIVTVSNNIAPDSRAVQFNSTGVVGLNAVYSGDSNNGVAQSTCEPVTINRIITALATTLVSNSITVGTTTSDSATLTATFQAGGTATYTVFPNNACTGTGTIASTVSVSNGAVPSSRPVVFNSTGSFSFQGSYSGDPNNNPAVSACEPLTVNKTNPAITTTLSSVTITVGNSLSDSATLTSGLNAGGTITYEFFTGSTCSGTASIVGTPVTVTNGNVPISSVQTFNAAGLYSWNAIYSGDANNGGATSPCEPLTVNKATPVLATTLSSPTPVVGTTETDSSSLASSFQASGTATYTIFAAGSCTGTGTTVSIVTVSGGVIPNSRAVLLNATGSYAFKAAYSGDSNNNGATSPCESFTVVKANPTISTTLSSTSIQAGQSVTDSAVLASAYQASGSVTYALLTNGACTGTGAVVSVVTVTNGVIPSSRSVLFNSTGSYSFHVSYSGDSNNDGATGGCEPLTVNPTTGVTVTTSLSSGTIIVGGSASDSAIMQGQTPTAGGMVTYSDFANGNCAGQGALVSVVSVTNGLVPDSRIVIFNSTGTYSFQAFYSGDSNNVGAPSPCEPLAVNKASPAITTLLSTTAITVGGSVTDSATLAGGFNAGGTVTYEFFTGSACSGTPTVAGTPVSVTSGVVPNSKTQTFNAAGSYSWNAIYSGDSNNNGVTSGCETLTVNLASPSIATALSSSSILVGATATDSATLSSSFQAGGSVTYSIFANAGCTAPETSVSVVAVLGGVVPNSRAVLFNSTGTYSFNAFYPGDANNNGATSPCEPLTINKANPTIATSISASAITVGSSVTDSSQLTGSYQAGGTVTYNQFSGATCSGTATIVSTVTITNGAIPNSASITPTLAGPYSLNAVYTGDVNNNPTASPCEPLQASKASPIITTSLSATTITVGSPVFDSATMTGFFQAGGSVTYAFYSGGSCSGTATNVGLPVTVAVGVIPNSASASPSGAGTYSFQAVYSGDANNNVGTSQCEPLTVNRASPTITTALSSQSISVGSSVFDASTLASSFQAGGSVTYTFFSNACTGTGTVVNTVQVTSGVVPNSSPTTPTSVGHYAFQATYSGDSNNNAASSTCEPLTVTSGAPTITTSLSASSITIGQSVTDSASLTGGFQPTGTISYFFFSTSSSCAATPTLVLTVAIGTSGSVPNSGPYVPSVTGSVSFDATYSGDSNNGATVSPCEPFSVIKATPTIGAILSATTVTVGQSVTNQATLSGGYPSTGVTGVVTYNYFSSNGNCAGSPASTTVTVGSNNSVPSSFPTTPQSALVVSFDAIYSGDAENNGATSTCEPLTVNKASPAVATTLSSNSITVGSSVTDSSTLASFFQASGTITYNDFVGGICAGSATIVSTVTVSNGIVPNSAAITLTPTGSYSFSAVYSGDANNNVATSPCEALNVNKSSPTIATTLSSTTITAGDSVTDSSAMANFFQAGGTLTYNRFNGPACTGTPTVVSTVPVTNGIVPNSAANTPTPAGAYGFNAVYSGDANNNVASSVCEPLVVNKASPTITTTLSASSITVGTSLTDSAVMVNFFQAGGSVTYSEFSGPACAGIATVVSTVVVANGVVPNSASVAPSPAGSFSFGAAYSGDANNNAATSVCEPLNINKTSPTIGTTLSLSSIRVGQTVTDSFTLSNSFQAGGTVTYTVFLNGACSAPGTVASIVTVTNGVGANSRAVLFNSTGSFSFQAAYSGDASNSGSLSPCEPLGVGTVAVVITTLLSSTGITVGQSVTDSATLSGQTSSAGGSVTYSYTTSSTCTGGQTIFSTVTVTTGGAVPNSRAIIFNSTGSFGLLASYSGDSKNSPANSICETLIVNKASPSITTSASNSIMPIGSTVTDSATLVGGFTAGGTVTYSLFNDAACTAPGVTVSGVTVTGGLVPSSGALMINATGSFGLQAAYGGDANNNAAISMCESLTVTQTSPTISTTLSSTTVNVGGSVTDSSILANSIRAGGTVTYEFFAGSACTGSATVVGTPLSVTNGVVPNSVSQTFNTAGAFSWSAIYSGDSNNAGTTSACESLAVNKASPTLTTNLSATTITVGSSVSDSAALASSFQAGGTVKYNEFADATCTGAPTVISTVTVMNGVVPSSGSVVPTPSGAYGFNAVYSGDVNNNGVSSTCEPLTINKASPTISTTLSAASITIGSSVTDSATLASFYQAGGPVTYNEFIGTSCGGTATIVSTVSVTNGVVPSSATVTPTTAGSYSFDAVYSGDANNNGLTSTCQTLTVLSPPVLSVPGTQSVTAGSTVRFVVNATDGTKTVTLTAAGLPSGATFSSTQSFAGGASSIFLWTPTDAQAPGDYNVTFTAQDSQGVSTVSHVTIHVSPVVKTAPLPIVTYSLFGIVGFAAVLLVALLLRRLQTTRRKP